MTDGVPSGQAWTDFCRALEQAGEVILRDTAPDTPLDRAEGYRYLTRLLREMLYTTIENSDPDFPRLHELDRDGGDGEQGDLEARAPDEVAVGHHR